jgi:hypothetical protein
VPATPLADQRQRGPEPFAASAPYTGFRGFAAGFHPSVDTFLRRHGPRLGGLTRVAEPEALVSFVADMRPDYLVLGSLSDRLLLDRIAKASRTAQLAVLAPGCGGPVGVEAGGLLVEPVSVDAGGDEMALVLRALLRRTRAQAMVGHQIWADLALDEACLTFSVRGQAASLSLEAFSVLGVMMDDPARIWARSDLHRHVFGATSRNDIRAIDTRISRTRRHLLSAIGCDPIASARGVGYRLVPEP